MRKWLLLCLMAVPVLATDVPGTFTLPALYEDGSALPAANIKHVEVQVGTCATVGANPTFGTVEGSQLVAPPSTSFNVTVPRAFGDFCIRARTVTKLDTVGNFTNVAMRSKAEPKPNPPVLTVGTVVRLYLRDNLSLVAGRVDIGVECGDQAQGQWHAIDRSAVQLNFIGRLARDVPIVAKCG